MIKIPIVEDYLMIYKCHLAQSDGQSLEGASGKPPLQPVCADHAAMPGITDPLCDGKPGPIADVVNKLLPVTSQDLAPLPLPLVYVWQSKEESHGFAVIHTAAEDDEGV